MFRKVPNLSIIFRARSIALWPFTPVRNRIAKSSELLNELSPFLSNFSRGRSSLGHDLIQFNLIFSVNIISLDLLIQIVYAFLSKLATPLGKNHAKFGGFFYLFVLDLTNFSRSSGLIFHCPIFTALISLR